jgi:hypothetical protein
MKVKIFTAMGFDDIAKTETQINKWIGGMPSKWRVVNTQTAMCQVAESANGERFQCVVISVWYQDDAAAQ